MYSLNLFSGIQATPGKVSQEAISAAGSHGWASAKTSTVTGGSKAKIKPTPTPCKPVRAPECVISLQLSCTLADLSTTALAIACSTRMSLTLTTPRKHSFYILFSQSFPHSLPVTVLRPLYSVKTCRLLMISTISVKRMSFLIDVCPTLVNA